MKKIILLMFVLVSLILLSACGNSPEVADLQSRLEVLEQENKTLKGKSQVESSEKSNEDEYLEFVRDWFKYFKRDFNTQNKVVQKMVNNPTLLTDDGWIKEITFSTADIDTSCGIMLKYDITLVPKEYLEGHNLLVKSTTDFQEATELIKKGIREKDILNGLNDSTKYVDSGAAYLSKATDFFKDVL